MHLHRAIRRGPERGVEPFAEGVEHGEEADAIEQRAVEAELPEHVGEEADPRDRGRDAAEALRAALLAVEEDRSRWNHLSATRW